MPNMRTEIWNVCQRFGGKYEFHPDSSKVVCKLKDGILEYDLSTQTLRGDFGPIEFEVSHVSRVSHVDAAVGFEDDMGNRVSLSFSHTVNIENRVPATLKAVAMAHPDPIYPGLRTTYLIVNLND